MKTSIHGMTSEDASNKKKGGHKREKVRAELLGEGAEVISGTGKADIIRGDGKTETVKGGKKTQWALYSLNRLVTDEVFSEKEISCIQEWVNFIPDDKNEWKKNRNDYKINRNAEKVYEIFKNNPLKLISYFCGVNIVDILSILDSRTNEWKEVTMEEFSEKISRSIKRVYFTEGGKFVIAGGEKNIILFEMELRKGGTHHKRILFHSLIHRIIDCLN